jgi:hypothetical protein
MGRVLIFLVVLFIAAFFANYFQIISIPWLDLPEVTTYVESSERTDGALKEIDE